MKRTILAVVCSLVLFFVGTGIALADEYTVVIDVAGEPMTLTVEADTGLSVADIDIVSVKPVAPVVSEVVGKQYTVVRSANLRAGPGTSFAVAGSAKVGDVVTVVGSNADNSWHELDSGAWVAAFLVEVVGVKPAATATPRTTVVPTRAPLPTVTPSPTSNLAWYEGGTLHDATVGEWLAADDRNRLATAADWAAVGFDLHSLRNIELGAKELLICIDGVISEFGDSASVTDIAISCIIFMKR